MKGLKEIERRRCYEDTKINFVIVGRFVASWVPGRAVKSTPGKKIRANVGIAARVQGGPPVAARRQVRDLHPLGVHAYGENTTWYSFAMYRDPESEARKHFEKTFGSLDEIGYKDLIPKLTAEKFDADEWAELFAKSGAKFAGPVAEHHDGFAMWDTKYSDWNAATMGPKRDIVGELEKAIKKRDMKFVTAFHHAANWFFFPVWDKRYDSGDPKYSGLYGQPHAEGAMRNQEFLDEWYGKIIEVIDNYSPDFIWFDFALDSIPEGYVKDFLA